jgi:hypothetical protein
MGDILISARIAPDDVLNAALAAGFPGSDSRASVVRYALLRAIGKTHEEAKSLARRELIKPKAGMRISSTNVHAKVDESLISEAEAKLGLKDRSTTVRYALAIAADYPPDEALAAATRTIGRPRKMIANQHISA